MKIDGSLGLPGVLLEPTTVVAKAWEQGGAPTRVARMPRDAACAA
jgi:hypothetical protein